MQVFENIYYAQRSDSCKSACVDIIVDNYNLIIDNKLDVKICKYYLIIFELKLITY